MILKRFSAPTLEEAKAEAREVYGENCVLLESDPAASGSDARITVIVDPKKEMAAADRSRQNEPLAGIRSTPAPGSAPGRRRSPLESVRSFARTQEKKQIDDRERSSLESSAEQNAARNGTSPDRKEDRVEPERDRESQVITTLYSRSMARPNAPGLRKSLRMNSHDSHGLPAPDRSDAQKSEKSSVTEPALPPRKPVRSEASKRSDGTDRNPVREERRHLQELDAVHRRFDRIESILNSSILSANLEYLTHPSFQQLVNVGVHPTVISGWFSSILRSGVDPYKDGRAFMHELASIIRTAVSHQSDTPTHPFLLFTGPSGGGKTTLIQKLILHPEFLNEKSVAVASLTTSGDHPYYTVLAPFCHDRKVPYFEVTPGEEIAPLLEEWQQFDHVLIDSPSLRIHDPESFRIFREQRRWLSDCEPMEVHYVVNAASQSLYFEGEAASNHPLRPDYLDITHLDEVAKWGHLIPMFQKLKIPTRYVSNGVEIPESLTPFDPARFTRQLLKKESTI